MPFWEGNEVSSCNSFGGMILCHFSLPTFSVVYFYCIPWLIDLRPCPATSFSVCFPLKGGRWSDVFGSACKNFWTIPRSTPTCYVACPHDCKTSSNPSSPPCNARSNCDDPEEAASWDEEAHVPKQAFQQYLSELFCLTEKRGQVTSFDTGDRWGTCPDLFWSSNGKETAERITHQVAEDASPDYSNPSPQACLRGACSSFATEVRPGSAPRPHRPLSPTSGITTASCPNG